MKLGKLVLASGGAGLLISGAILGSAILGSALAAGPTTGPTTTISTTIGTTAGRAASATQGSDTAVTARGADTDNVQSGAQSGAQVEDKTPDVVGATEATDTGETAGHEADAGSDQSQPATPPTVTQSAAIKDALAAVPGANSTPVTVRLDDENGQPVYDILLAIPTGHQMVKVNGLTGAVTLSHDSGVDRPERDGGATAAEPD